jgi:hypothetical protein
VSFAIGIGAATAVSAVDSLLLHPYPYADADRILVISQADDAGTFVPSWISGERFGIIRQARSLEDAITSAWLLSSAMSSRPQSVQPV